MHTNHGLRDQTTTTLNPCSHARWYGDSNAGENVSTSTCGIFLLFFLKPLTRTPRNELTRITWVSQLSPPPKKGGARPGVNPIRKPSQTTLQMTDPVTNPKQKVKAMVRDASQASLWHQDSLYSRDNYLWEVFYHYTFSTNARCARCLHHMHNTRDLWRCCCARADSPSLTLFKVLNSIIPVEHCNNSQHSIELYTYPWSVP